MASTTRCQANDLPNTLNLDSIQILDGKSNDDNWGMYVQLSLERSVVRNLTDMGRTIS